MNILVNEFTVNDACYSIEHDGTCVSLEKMTHIDKAQFHSFGLFPKLNPFFCKESFEATLSFQYEFSDDNIVRVYNGKRWMQIGAGGRKGTVRERITLDGAVFTNFRPKWRIGFANAVDWIRLTNVELVVDQPDKPYLLLVGASIWGRDLEPSCFCGVNCYYLGRHLSTHYNVLYCQLTELLDNMRYLTFDLECAVVTNLHGLMKKGCANRRVGWTKELLDAFRARVAKKIVVSTDSVNDLFVTDPTCFNDRCHFVPSISQAVKHQPRVRQVYWAADPDAFYPDKDADKFTILIDDCHYGQSTYADGRHHKNYEILKHCMEIMEANDHVYVCRFGFGDAAQNFVDEYKGKHDRYTVVEHKLPLRKKALFHNSADVFWCTHYETLGIPNIESAMSDCLLVHPRGFVNKELTQHLDHIDYDDIREVTLDKMVSMYEPGRQRGKALEFTWEKKCQRIMQFINE